MSLKHSYKTVAIVSDEHQINFLLSNEKNKKLGDIHFICLTPIAEYIASTRKIHYTPAEILYNPFELNKISASSWLTFDKLSKHIISKIDFSFNSICTKGYYSSDPHAYLLKKFHDTVVSNLKMILLVIESFSPSNIVCFIEPSVAHHSGLDFFFGDLNYKLLELLKDRYDYNLICYNIDKPKKDSNNKFNLKEIFVQTRERINSVINEKINISRITSVFNQNHELPTIAIGQSNTLANLPQYLRGWKDRGGTVKNFKKDMRKWELIHQDIDKSPFLQEFGITTNSLKKIWKKLKLDPEITKHFEYNGINFFSIVSPWLEKFIYIAFPRCVLAEEFIEKLIVDTGASAFFTPSIAFNTQLAAILTCKRLHIKTFNVQHGAMGFTKSFVLEYTDYRNIDYALVYGPGVANYFRLEYKTDSRKNIAKPIAIGNPILHDIYHKYRNMSHQSPGRKRRIIYVPTAIEPEFTYYSWSGYPPMWYTHFHMKVIDLVKRFPDVTLYIKSYPSLTIEDPLQMYVKDKNIKNVVFLPRNIDVTHYLNKADLFINDFPSTSLLKILCTKKPVIVYFNPKYFDMPTEAQKILKKRAELYTIENKFFNAIKKYCKKIEWPEINNPDDSFLHQYGICDPNITPQEKLVNHLQSVI